MRSYLVVILAIALFAAGCTTTNEAEQHIPDIGLPPEPPELPVAEVEEVAVGTIASLEYVGTLANGEVFDASQGDVLEFIVGAGMILRAFEENILGMRVGEERTFTLTPEEAYGVRDEALIDSLAREEFGETTPEEGMVLTLADPQTQEQIFATVLEVGEETVLLDLNHPLAGEELTFTVELVGLEALPEGDIFFE